MGTLPAKIVSTMVTVNTAWEATAEIKKKRIIKIMIELQNHRYKKE